MAERISDETRACLHQIIDDADHLVCTSYGWSGDYEIISIELRRYIGPPTGGGD